MASLSDYQDLLTYLAQNTQSFGAQAPGWDPEGTTPFPDDYKLWVDSGSGDNVATNLNQSYLTDPGHFGLFDTNPHFQSSGASLNPFFNTQVRDYEYALASQLGLTKQDADLAALGTADYYWRANGQPYSEANSPVVIADRINRALYEKAGKPYTGLTPDEITHYNNTAQDFQTSVKGQRSDVEDAADLQTGLWAGSVLAGPVLGSLGAGGGATGKAGADAAGLFGTSGSDVLLGGAGEDLLGGGENPFADPSLPGSVNPTSPSADPTYSFPPSPTTASNVDPSWEWPGGTTSPTPPDIPVAGPGPFPASPDASLGSSGLGTLGTATAAGAGAGAANNALNNNSDDSGTSGGSGNDLLNTLLGGGAAAAGGGNLGSLLAALLGGAGAYNQTEALKDMFDKQMAMGQPYRDDLLQLYADPMSYLSSPAVTGAVQQGTDALARSLSVKGNPFGNGTSLQTLQNYATKQQLDRLDAEKKNLANFGGLSNFNAAAPGTGVASVNASGGMYDAAGYGLASLLNPNRQNNSMYGLV